MEPLNIYCLKWGNKYKWKDVNRLYNNVKKYSSVPFNFYCITDSKKHSSINKNVNLISLPKDNDLEGSWNKIYLFDYCNEEGINLFFDLDIVIQKDWSVLLESYNPDKLIMVNAVWKRETGIESDFNAASPLLSYDINVNGSVLLWNKKINSNIWNKFNSDIDFYLIKYEFGNDRFLVHEKVVEIDTFPLGIIYSRLYGGNVWGDEKNKMIKMRSLKGTRKDPMPTNMGKQVTYFDADLTICLYNGPVWPALYGVHAHRGYIGIDEI